MRQILLWSARMIAAAASAAAQSRGKRNATRTLRRDHAGGSQLDLHAPSRRFLMIEFLVLFGASMLFLALLAFVDPCLVGWRTRRDAAVVFAIAVTMLTAGWAAAYF